MAAKTINIKGDLVETPTEPGYYWLQCTYERGHRQVNECVRIYKGLVLLIRTQYSELALHRFIESIEGARWYKIKEPEIQNG